MEQREFMTVDGIPVELNGEKNLLELIRKAGIKLPTFCYHSELSVYGACRMCMVETERGGLEAACSTPPKGHSGWTLVMIRDKAIELRLVDSVSTEGVRKLLKKRLAAPSE